MHGRRVGRKLELGQDGIDHVLFAFEQIGQKDFVLDELRRIALQLRNIIREQLLKTVARFHPIFFQEGNLRQIETRVPEFRIDAQGFVQSGFRFVVNSFPHQNDTAQIL